MSNQTRFCRSRITTFLCVFISSTVLALAGFAENCFAQDKPNIILITLDDADFDVFEVRNAHLRYRNITEIANSGISFTNVHATTPFCGPSRACLYRAQYAHNTGIRVNDPAIPSSHGFTGGMAYYDEQGYFENDLGTWMQDAGYRTMMIGKFLHHEFRPIIPKGWDDFHSYLGARYYETFRFTNENAPQGRGEVLPPGLYRTTEETRDVVRTINRHIARDDGRPFFLNVNPYGPHLHDPASPGMVDTKLLHLWPNVPMPFALSHNESDISDKRGYYKGLPEFNEWQLDFTKATFRDRVLAMRSCDDMVGTIRRTLRRNGLEDNTYILITSDNGYLNGHHRSIGKGTSYDRSTRVPTFVIGPDVPEGRKADHLIAHIDIGPTIVELAGGKAPGFVDGRSFAHLLTPTGIDDNEQFRSSMLIENWAQHTFFGVTVESASTALRTVDWIYTEWANGDKDFFNLQDDPDQLDNSYPDLHPNMRDFVASVLRTHKNPNQKSKAQFSVPFEEGEQIPVGQRLRGVAEDSQGVEHVRLALFDIERNRYWNGTRWQTGFFLLRAELENQGGQITFWNYDEMPVGNQVAPGMMAAWVWSYDENFRHDETPTLRFFRN